MDQTEFIRRISELPGRLAWFLGAGASQSAGLPTAIDIIWDLKRRYYQTEENQKVSPNDLQNPAVKEKIEGFLSARGFPTTYEAMAYSRCFELAFGTDLDRQRKYLKGILSENNSSLALGHRVFAALIATGFVKAVFTSNFDTVVERALAEVAGKDIAPFHLEGAYAASVALNNDEFPLYCKLHGDFRYESLKNLASDLLSQNQHLGECFVNAATRFGVIVAGYSGRDESVMNLLSSVLDGRNPYPHGLYWTGIKGREPLPQVRELLAKAQMKGVAAEYVEIETFDSLMSRIWKAVPGMPPELGNKIGKIPASPVSIPLASQGNALPILRMNAMPVVRVPDLCWKLTFDNDKEWKEIRDAEFRSKDKIICTKGASVLAWGKDESLRDAFGSDLRKTEQVTIRDLLSDLDNNLHLKGFLQRALCLGLMRGKPLLCREWRDGLMLIVDRMNDISLMTPGLKQSVGGTLYGSVPGVMTEATEEFPNREQLWWAEAVKVDLELVNDAYWLLLKPDIWIWPKRSRELATKFLDERTCKRFNKQADELLSAWIKILLPGDARAINHVIAPFDGEENQGCPRFIVNSRTAFSRKISL